MGEHGISVVIPLFNKSHVIADVLLSVLNQSSPPDELIVVDDASSDGSLDIAQSFWDAYQKHFPIKVLRNTNCSGPSFTRNVGIEHSSQDYLYFLDADDLMFPNTILNLRKAISITKPDIIFTKALLGLSKKIHPSKKIFNYAEKIEKNLFKIVEPFGLLADEFPFVGSNFAIRKSFPILFDINERQFEDCLFVYEHVLRADRIVYLDQFSIIYGQDPLNNYSRKPLNDPHQASLPKLYHTARGMGHLKIAGHIFFIWMSYLATRASNRGIALTLLKQNRAVVLKNFRLNQRYISPFLRILLPYWLFNYLHRRIRS